MRVFFDTSAFVKKYLEEPSSDRVIKICGQTDDLVLSIICLPEMISTLNRLVREGRLSLADYRTMRDLMLKEIGVRKSVSSPPT